MVNHWIFVVTDQKVKNRVIEAIDLFNSRMRHKFWSFSTKNPRLKRVTKNDKVAFLKGGEDGNTFVGTAKLASDPSPPSREFKKYVVDIPEKLMREVRLEETRLFEKPKPIRDILDKLSFIEKKDRWQAYLQGGHTNLRTRLQHNIIGLTMSSVSLGNSL